MSLVALSNPVSAQIDGALFDYFLVETVNTLRQSSAVATRRQKELEDEMAKANLLPQAPNQRIQVQDTEDEALKLRLEGIGAQVGASLVERLVKDRPRFTDTLDSVKFICKDVWTAVWEKQVDNLRTNHRGVYVLQDNSFRPLLRISSPNGASDAVTKARIYLAFHAGVLRGALSRLGLQGTVVPEVTNLPQCVFQIKLPKS
ncbi:Trafficking protein particle complex subunit 33 [Serendipita sp. 396]|nr:Trafficking protein particle complex subunit 33 [Serendipita sp. 396]KAG8786268.1 Trafficking protein particle complex subunit 33 [Serendipita sp. 397]KAG8801533.1 Trafficking protein particle complex subunit 33 [Serendipita sp. 398]KAG8824979.1 Trafficking protein particle complex subunit 33 [Serendipita sp. 401]KAG8835747.1 Trafficking protein particle complex subunit 33 [Serendipita sp. 400]KAG8855793.1 Trafficking protein particle complex subunit 33 [Serendipita sp. 411]KAG8870251.1 Tr